MSTFKVSDMTCGHCEKSIKAELQREHPEVKVEVDLKTKLIQVENLPDAEVIHRLEEIGYTPEKVK